MDLSASFNVTGIYANGATFPYGGGLSMTGGYSSSLLGSTVNYGGNTFNIGPAGAADAIAATGQTVSVPQGNYSTVVILAAAVEGNLAANFTFNYTTGAATTVSQNVSDWTSSQGNANEAIAVSMPYYNQFNGTTGAQACYLYAYTFLVDNTRTLDNIVLPNITGINNLGVKVFAVTLVS